jgi:hypothetical protein
MTTIHVPRPPKDAMNTNRPANALLLKQVEHMHEAERRLPLRYRTDIYINSIKTEGEAAQYMREVTTAIHRAHEEATRKRAKPASKRKTTLQIAAVAEEEVVRKRTGKTSNSKRARTTPKKK